jgi:hypothetical protein
LAIEFAESTTGRFYSVGQYMDPRSRIDAKKAPAALIRACLMSPDPYMPSRGEKTVHRYNLGTGEKGRENIAALKKYIEGIQNWSKDPETGTLLFIHSHSFIHSFLFMDSLLSSLLSFSSFMNHL